METKFQTSFIPKKPFSPIGGLNVQQPRRATSSLFMTLAGFLFIVSLLAAGGMYFWKSYLLSSQESYKTQLAEREKQFNADLIEELKSQNVKIDLPKNLIDKHLAASQIFDIIGRLTIENVRFLSMDMTAGATSNDGIKINLKGNGTCLSAVAFHSDVLGQLERYGLRKVVKNPILSDPSIDTDRTVSFGLTATVDPVNLSYKKSLEALTGADSGSAASSTNPDNNQ